MSGKSPVYPSDFKGYVCKGKSGRSPQRSGKTVGTVQLGCHCFHGMGWGCGPPRISPAVATTKMPLKAVIFDFDGVVVDSEHLHFEAILEVAKKAVGVDFDFDYYMKHFIQFDDRDCFREAYRMAKRELDESNGVLEALCAEKQTVLERLLQTGCAV